MPLIGIYNEKYPIGDLEFEIRVSPRFRESRGGNETEIFAKLPDAIEIIGGGIGSAMEFAHIMKINKEKLSEGKEPTYIAPVSLTGKACFSSSVFTFPMEEELRVCVPDYRILNGKAATYFLKERLKFNDN